MHPSIVLPSAQRVRLLGALGSLAFASLASAANVSFDVRYARLWLDEKQVLPFQSTAAPAKRVFDTTIEPADMAEILQPATILDGEKTGFLRLKPLKTGRAILHVGDAALHIDIKTDMAAELSGQKEPRIISPLAGACVYGTVSVGVDIPVVDPGSPDPKVHLVAGDGTEIQPRAQTLPVTGADRIYSFDVNADQFAAGPLRLQAVSEDQTGIKRQSEPVYVAAFRPDPSAVLAGACADHMEGARPQRFGDKWPPVLKDDPAAPEGYVSNKSADPVWLLSENLPEAGYYQMFLRARGDAGAGSFPSIGLLVDDKDKPETTVRLMDTAWQRIAVGRPVYLEAGEHVLAAKYLNKFSVGQNAQRNLYLERYELVRVSKAAGSASGTDPEMTMMMEGGGAEMMKAGTDASALFGVNPLRVAFIRPFDGQIADGPLRIAAQAWWQNGFQAPSVDLLVNGTVVQTQYGSDLDFHLPVEALKPGKNILNLRASLANGITAESPEQTVTLPSVPLEKTASVPRMLRYGIMAPGWDPSLAQRFEKTNAVTKPSSAVFYANGESTLSLPDNLTGDFKVRLDARGQEYGGPPVAQCVLHAGDITRNVGEAPVSGGTYRTVDLGIVHLDKGPKQIVIRYANASATPQTGPTGRNWWLKALRLEETAPIPLRGPDISLDYVPGKVSPADGQSDAVVVRCFAQDGIRWADLAIDGKPQDIQTSPKYGMGRLVFPLLARSLTPGDHVLQVLATSQGGKQATSQPVHFTVVSTPVPPVENRYARAMHLLNRFGYGPEPDEVADILVNGEESWMRDRLSRTWDDPNERAVMALVGVRYPDADHNDVVGKALLQLLLTRNPVRARFTLWAENHFSTWMQKVQTENKGNEHQRFLELGVAPFRDLLFASATSPAMLLYLDQVRSYANRLNENYAREIMELHTVGVHGGYTQADVTGLAGILTGWTLSQDAPLTGSSPELVKEFRYEPMADSPAAHRIFGMDFPAATPEQRYDRTHSALEMLASHPSAAHFISEKLAQQYVGVPAPESLVDRLATVFEQRGGDMAEMLVTIANSPEFWDTMDKPRLATPFDYSIRLCRMTGSANTGAVAEYLRKSGTGLFDRVTPDGFPETDASYADSNSMLQRWNFTKSIQNDLRSVVPQSLASKQGQWGPEMQDQMLDVAAARLLGRTLSLNSRQAASDYLKTAASGQVDHSFITTAFLAQLPENNLR